MYNIKDNYKYKKRLINYIKLINQELDKEGYKIFIVKNKKLVIFNYFKNYKKYITNKNYKSLINELLNEYYKIKKEVNYEL